MKILHTADWHLGKWLGNFSRLEEQKLVLEEICQIAEQAKVDAVLVAGDLYDHFNPPIEATELLYKTFKRLTRNGTCPVIAIAGNHDSPDRIQAPEPLARECGIIFLGYPHALINPFELESGLKLTQAEKGFLELQLPNIPEPLRILMTPYVNEIRLKTYLGLENREEELRILLQDKWQELANRYCDDKGINILMTHLFMMKKGEEPPEEPEDEKSILHVGGAQPIFSENIPKQMQYVALGHLHRCQVIDKQPCPVVYSGSPLAYSFAEANQAKYVVLLEAEAGKPMISKKIRLKEGKNLLQKTFEDVTTAIQWLEENQNTWVELTIVTETFLTSEEKKKLYKAHKGIVNVLPAMKNLPIDHPEAKFHQIDLKKSTETLFVEYFKHKNKGQNPNENLMQLLKEILHT